MDNPADKTAAHLPQPEVSARKKRKPKGRLECNLGILLGLCGLIGSRLGQLWIAFDVFSQFTLQFIVVTVAFIIGRVMPRAKLLTAFLVLILGVTAIGVWPHLATRSPTVLDTAAADEKMLRVASFNTFYANDQVDAVKAEVQRIDADVIALVEVGPNKRPMLDDLRSRYPYQANCFSLDYCNLAILSKLPIAETSSQVGWEGAPYLAAKLGPEAGGLTVIAVHTIRFPHSRAQYRQVEALAARIESMPGRKLVMGDFNATPFSRIIDGMVGRAGLKRLSKLPSWPSQVDLPQIAIDHIFVSPGIRLLESQQIGKPAGSDHFPIIMAIAVPTTR